jgi:L-threonylcarbamoyladenylate synthase
MLTVNQASTYILPAGHESIRLAAARLQAGGLVAFPTETVYGLGADATNEDAVAAIYAAKGRPSNNPLIVHLARWEDAALYAEISPMAERVMRHFWPGPLTLVLPRRAACPLARAVSAGGDSVALRVPAHPLAQTLLAEAGCPIAAPSANPSGRISPTQAVHVRQGLPDKGILVLDGGPCAEGLESTIIRLHGERLELLRPGSITREALGDMLPGLVEMQAEAGADGTHAPLPAPGMMASHYAPRLPVRLNATHVEPDEALLAFGPDVPAGAARTLNLSESGELAEAAHRLFSALHALDAPDAPYRAIAVMPIPAEGVGLAIRDRLARAAAPRD